MQLRSIAHHAIRALAAGLISLTAATAGVAAAELPFGQPKVAYSGVTVTEIGGQSIETRVFYTPGRQRNETETAVGPQVMLLDFERHVAYMLMPLGRSYMEMPMGPHGMAGAAADDPEGTVEHEVVGREAIAGQETTKYSFRVTTPEGATQGFAWVTDEGILMRSEAELVTPETGAAPGKIVISLRDLSIGPQDPALFELPADYRKLDGN